ncbi:MAG: tetratricopeptide repeat protein [Alphaproteobacteria bacterium]|nr:tetratricopeptide repeat protein [Alphaproteobacteria bacterium]
MEPSPSEIDRRINEIQADLSAKRWADAEQKAASLADRFPTSPAGLLFLGQIAVLTKPTQHGIELLKTCVEQFPSSAQAQLSLARAYAAIYRHGAAEQHLQAAVQLSPESIEARFLLGQNLFKAGRSGEAIPHLQHVADRQTRDFRANFLLGTALTNVGELDQAAKYLRRAADLNPADAMASHQSAELDDSYRAKALPRGPCLLVRAMLSLIDYPHWMATFVPHRMVRTPDQENDSLLARYATRHMAGSLESG